MVLSDRTIRKNRGRTHSRLAPRRRVHPAGQRGRGTSTTASSCSGTRGGRTSTSGKPRDGDGLTEMVEIDSESPFKLHPGEFVLGSTTEHIELPEDLVARLEGKSSLGRIGLLIHSTAGYVDPGWKGHLTWSSATCRPARDAVRGHEEGQISFLRLTTPAENLTGPPPWAASTRARPSQPPAASTDFTDGRSQPETWLHVTRLELARRAEGRVSPNPPGARSW